MARDSHQPWRETPSKATARLMLLLGASLGVEGGKAGVFRTSEGSAGSTSDAPASGGASSSTGAPSSGRARSSGGLCTPRGDPCVFPFRYGRDRTLYYECTTVDSDWADEDKDGDYNDGEPWCGAVVNVTYDTSTFGRCVECPPTTTAPSTTLGTTTTAPVVWLSLIGGGYYVNLPVVDNWAMYGAINTTWTKLRIVGTPHLGDASVTIDLHDWTYSSTKGEDPSSAWSRVEWGIAGACQGDGQMHVSLQGTPFAFEPALLVASGSEAHGSVTCARDRQTCVARCGGWCGFCGLGEPGVTASAQLEVVDRGLYDAALWHMFDAAREALLTSTTTKVHHSHRSYLHSIEATEEVPEGGWTLFSGIMSCLLVAVCCACAARLARGGGKADGSASSGCLGQFMDFVSNLRAYGKFNGDDSSPEAATPRTQRSTSLNTLSPQPPPRTIGT